MEEKLRPVLDTPMQELRAKSTDPLEAAKLDLSLAYAINTMFWTYLRVQGIAPEDHPVSTVRTSNKRMLNQSKLSLSLGGSASTSAVQFDRKRFWQSSSVAHLFLSVADTTNVCIFFPRS